jgi:hypothetical protein
MLVEYYVAESKIFKMGTSDMAICVYVQGFIYGEGYQSLQAGDNLYTQLGNMETFRVEERKPLTLQVFYFVK